MSIDLIVKKYRNFDVMGSKYGFALDPDLSFQHCFGITLELFLIRLYELLTTSGEPSTWVPLGQLVEPGAFLLLFLIFC